MEVSAVWTAVLVVGLSALLLPVGRWLLQWLQTRHRMRTTSIPGPPVSDVITGHAGTLVSDKVHLTMSDWVDTYGPIFRIQILNNFAVVVTDPAAIQQLLRKNSPDYAHKFRELYRALEIGTKPQVPNILTSSDDAYWKAVRTGLAPCFSITNLKKLFPRVSDLTQRALAVVGDAAAARAEVDVAELAKRVTSDVMGSMLLDQDFGGIELRPDPYMDSFNEMLVESHKYFSNPLRSYMVWDADARAGVDVMARHDKILEQKLAAALKTPPAEHTIAGHLFKVKDPATGKPLKLPQLKAELGIVLGAGFETTSHAITWTLAALATHPQVQEQLAAELAAAGLRGRPYEWGDLARLPYLNAVLKESLRLFSPASLGTSRYADRDMVICGHKVPRGTNIMIPLGPVGLSSYNYGASARTFSPERWLNGTTTTTTPSTAAAGTGDSDAEDGAPGATAAAAAGGGPPDPTTFSLGPRDCIGQALAKLELQVVVASLVAKFKFTPGAALAAAVEAAAAAGGPGAKDPQVAAVRGIFETAQYHITLQPKAGLLLVAAPR